jgi:putative NADH-flavin reductase
MKIALIGATGNVGSRILDEALRRGHEVTAIARDISKLAQRPKLRPVAGDVADATALAKSLAGHDVVISSVRFLTPHLGNVVTATKAAGVPRLAVVGGAGSLEVAPGVALLDTPNFPAAYKAEATAGRDFLVALRRETTLDWTFLSPSAFFHAGERTGKFRLGTDELLTAGDGKSSISYEDYATALLDEIEAPKHPRGRFTVGY